MPAEVRCEVLVKFEIPDVKCLVKFGVRLFDLPGKHPKFRGKFPETSFQISRLFWNVVQQKGGVNLIERVALPFRKPAHSTSSLDG